MDRALYGREPLGFHLTVWLLHGLTSYAVYLMARRLLPAASAVLAASLFAVFPLHPECVGWIAGRTDVVATLFCVLAATLFLEASRGTRGETGAGPSGPARRGDG